MCRKSIFTSLRNAGPRLKFLYQRYIYREEIQRLEWCLIIIMVVVGDHHVTGGGMAQTGKLQANSA